MDVADGIYTSTPDWAGMIRADVQAIVASAIPVKPPLDWFNNPGFNTLTPMRADGQGRVSGHVASWRQDHIGMAGRVKAPKSRSNYAFFATGVLETAEGEMVNVGQITLAGGHASLEASVADVVAHYDNTQSGVMDVSIGEDKHGIWVAGALRPDVDDAKLRTIRASSVSGDWRPINGNLELVAVCAVNVPGFPIPQARVAGGAPLALVAAGTLEIVELIQAEKGSDINDKGMVAALTAMDERLRLIENAMLGRVQDNRAKIDEAISASAALDTDDGTEGIRAALRADVKGEVLVWDDGLAYYLSTAEGVQASLRARAKGLTSSVTAGWSKDRRTAASKAGLALPDGSFPIATRTDWYKAKGCLASATNRAATVRHLKRRGRTLGIPKVEWGTIPMRAT